jgi:hypothetical protein
LLGIQRLFSCDEDEKIRLLENIFSPKFRDSPALSYPMAPSFGVVEAAGLAAAGERHCGQQHHPQLHICQAKTTLYQGSSWCSIIQGSVAILIILLSIYFVILITYSLTFSQRRLFI